MERIVVKLGAISLDGSRAAEAILTQLDLLDDPLVVVPAFKGATKVLSEAADARAVGASTAAYFDFLRERHLAIARAMDAPVAAHEAASLRLEGVLRRLSALPSPTASERRAEFLAAGSRLSAACVALALVALGRPAALLEPQELGLLVAAGPKGPCIDAEAAAPRLRSALGRFPSAVLPGDFGVDAEGRPVLLGRRGSAVAAAIAQALGARFHGTDIARADGPFARSWTVSASSGRSSFARNPGVA